MTHPSLRTAAAALSLLPAAVVAVPLTILPPDELVLDGVPIDEGTFNLTEVIGYSGGDSGDSSIVETTLLASGDPPLTKPAVIGTPGLKDLMLDIPVEIEVLKLTGFFEPLVPAPSPATVAAFEIIVGVLTLDNGPTTPVVVDNFTYYLPLDTSMFFPQVTDLGMDADRASLGDNADSFFPAATTFALTVEDPSTGIKLDNGVDNPWWVLPSGSPSLVFAPPPPGGATMPNCPPPMSVTVQRHGSTTTRLVPGPCDPPSTGVAEPASAALLALGALAAAGLARRPRVAAVAG